MPNLNIKQKIKAFILPTAFLVISSLGFNGCTNTNALKDAQQAFSTAAQLENRQKANQFSPKKMKRGIPAVESAAINAAYSAAIDSLSKADEGALKKMGLLSNAYALRAISYWRLQKYPLALGNQKAALQLHEKEKNNTLGDRDYVMMSVLPNLIDNDKTRKKIVALKGNKPDDASINPLLTTLTKTIKSLDNNTNLLPKNQPMRSYLLVSRLGAFSNYKDACLLISRQTWQKSVFARDKCITKEMCAAKHSYQELKDLHPKVSLSSFNQLFEDYQHLKCPKSESKL